MGCYRDLWGSVCVYDNLLANQYHMHCQLIKITKVSLIAT